MAAADVPALKCVLLNSDWRVRISTTRIEPKGEIMRTLMNDEIVVPASATKDRRPSDKLRLRETDEKGMILEQLWESPIVGVEDEWVPVPFIVMPSEKKLNTHKPITLSRPGE